MCIRDRNIANQILQHRLTAQGCKVGDLRLKRTDRVCRGINNAATKIVDRPEDIFGARLNRIGPSRPLKQMSRQALWQGVEADTKKGAGTSPGVCEGIFEGLAGGSSGLCHGARILHESGHRVTLAARSDRNSHLSRCLVCKSGRDNLQHKISFYSHLIENYHFTAPKACWHDSGISFMKSFQEEMGNVLWTAAHPCRHTAHIECAGERHNDGPGERVRMTINWAR